MRPRSRVRLRRVPSRRLDEVRAATRRPGSPRQRVINSSVMPRLKCAWPPASLRSSKGRTASARRGAGPVVDASSRVKSARPPMRRDDKSPRRLTPAQAGFAHA